MISAIISFIGGLFQIAGKVFDWLYANRLVEAGRKEQQLTGLKEQIKAANDAIKKRIDVERDLAVGPDRLRDDDGFRRADDE